MIRKDRDKMGKIKIITDSASDITFEAEKEHNIKVLSFSVVLGDKDYVSRVDFDNEGFYDLMIKNSNEIPKTSQITAFQFEELYEKCAKEGYEDLILVLINGNGSATYQNSLFARQNFFEEHPEYEGKVNITSHNSLSYTGAYGHLVIEAAKMAENGSSAKQINEYLEKAIEKRRIYFGMYDLTYAGKSGRIPTAAAFLGNKLGIKPIMKISDGEITTAAKCRGDKKLLSKVLDLTMKDIEPGSEYQIVYGKNTECRDEMIKKMTDAMGYGPCDIYQVGAEVATNAGMHLAGVIFNVKEGV